MLPLQQGWRNFASNVNREALEDDSNLAKPGKHEMSIHAEILAHKY